MTKTLGDFLSWLQDKGTLVEVCVIMALVSPLCFLILFLASSDLRFTDDLSIMLTGSIWILGVAYGIYNTLRYVYETTVSKS